MSLVDRIAEESRRIILNPRVMRIATDDRVKRVAEGVLDAKDRVRAALRVLVTAETLPHVDPALDDSIGQSEESFTRERSTLGTSTQQIETSSAADAAPKRYNGSAVVSVEVPTDFNDGPEAVVNGQRVTMFGSNNYLGLTTHPKVREAARAAIERFGTSMTGSRLVNGSMRLHEEFEEKLAAWFNKEFALVFTTGYQVNLATCSALLSNKKPPKSAMLRTSYMATHERAHLDRGLEAFYKVGKKYGVI